MGLPEVLPRNSNKRPSCPRNLSPAYNTLTNSKRNPRRYPSTRPSSTRIPRSFRNPISNMPSRFPEIIRIPLHSSNNNHINNSNSNSRVPSHHSPCTPQRPVSTPAFLLHPSTASPCNLSPGLLHNHILLRSTRSLVSLLLLRHRRHLRPTSLLRSNEEPSWRRM